MSSATLTVFVDAKKAQAELAKIPGWTEKAAAKAGLKMAMEAERANQKAAAAAEKAAKRAGDAWDVALKVKVVDMLGNAATTVAQTFGQWAMDGITAADAMADLSQESGVAVTTLLAIRDAAMLAGEDANALQQSFAGMAKKIYEFGTTGGGKAAAAFEELGVQVKNADGSFRSVNAITVETITKLQAIEDKTKQAALATKLLGDSGQEMLRVLGDRSLDEWAGSMEDAAVSVQSSAAAVDQLNLGLDAMKQAAAGVGTSLLDAFGPTLAKMLVVAGAGVEELVSDVGTLKDLLATSVSGDTVGFNAALDEFFASKVRIEAAMNQRLADINSIGTVPNSPLNPNAAADPFANGPLANAFGGESAPARQPTSTANRAQAAATKAHDDSMAMMQERFDAAMAGDAFLKQIDDERIAEIARVAEAEQTEHEAALARIAERQAAEAAAAEQRKQNNEQIVQGALNLAGALFDIANQQLQDQVDATRRGSEENKAALRRQWEAQHAAATASALVNIALATSQALGSAPFPANVVLGALSAAAATAAFVKVASAKPPTFHVGSMGNRASNRGSDEYDARLKRNEVVVPAPTVVANGGPGGVERALTGGASTYIAVSIDGKELDAAVDRRLAARGIPPRGHKFRAIQ